MTKLPSGPVPAMQPGDEPDDALLGRAFAAARALAPSPAPALIDRVLADAAMLQPHPTRPAARPAKAGMARGALADLVTFLGGWRGLGGMVTAAAAGVWIGVAGSAAGFVFPAFANGASAQATVVELLPGADSFGVAGAAGGEM